jgi:hypothetical protein
MTVTVFAQDILVFSRFQKAVLEQQGVLFHHEAQLDGVRGKQAWAWEISNGRARGKAKNKDSK